MNIAIIGNSTLNDVMKQHFAAEGFSTVCIEDIGELRSLSGEPGSFSLSLRTSGGTIDADWIVVTEPVKGESDVPFGISLSEARTMDVFDDKGQPIVFLLDYPKESPAFMTRLALEKAVALAKKKKRVLYLSKFMRTAEPGMESLYSAARIAGVGFVKYESLNISCDDEEGECKLTLHGGYENLEISTSALILADGIATDAQIDRAAKALRLKNFENGVSKTNAYYLFPTFTSRKGIHVLSGADGEIGPADLAFYLRHIVASIRDAFSKQNALYAVVDAAKCAYCYTCYRVCPHGAMAPDPENSAMRNLNSNCNGCGICISVCPASAIELCGVAQESAERSSGGMKVFCCENSGEIALKKLSGSKSIDKPLSIASVPCGGIVSAQQILSALNDHENVLVLVCIDEACRHEEGNKRAMKQVERAKSLLRAAGMDDGRVQVQQLSAAMPMSILECFAQV